MRVPATGGPLIGIEIITSPPGLDLLQLPAPTEVGHRCSEHDSNTVPAGNFDKSSVNVNGLCNATASEVMITGNIFTEYPSTPRKFVLTPVADLVILTEYPGAA